VAPESFAQVMPRLETFMKPLVRIFQGQAAEHHAQPSVYGLWSQVERQNIASMASRCGQSRLPVQGFMGGEGWDDAPLRAAWPPHSRRPVGHGDGVWVCDPSGLPKTGRESVGVARPWGGRLGNVDHGHGAISLGEVSRQGHTLVDSRRSRPHAWTTETARRDNAGVPKTSRAERTRHPWVVARLAAHGAALPHRWMAGEDERGRPSWFRHRLTTWNERSLLGVPSHTASRALATVLPA
jgi:SRSO17 transposase